MNKLTKAQNKSVFPKCKKCGVEFGLHDSKHYFVGNPYSKNKLNKAQKKENKGGEKI